MKYLAARLIGIAVLASSEPVIASEPMIPEPAALIWIDYQSRLLEAIKKQTHSSAVSESEHLDWLYSSDSVEFLGDRLGPGVGRIGQFVLYRVRSDTAEVFMSKDPLVRSGLAKFHVEYVEPYALEELRQIKASALKDRK